MSTTSNIIAGVTLTAALVGASVLLSPSEALVGPDAGVVDAGQRAPLIGNFYLRFPDQAVFNREVRSTPFWQWEYAQVDAGVDDAGIAHHKTVQLDAGALITTAMGHNFDIVGTITRPILVDGGPDPDGGTEELDGFHVNFSGILPPEWEGYIVHPEHPVRGMR